MSFIVRLGTTSAIAQNGSGVEGTTQLTIPMCSTYKTTSTTLVDSARNTQGIVVANVIRAGIRKIEMTWRVISVIDYAKLGTWFNTNFMCYAYYFDLDTNSWRTIQVYVGNRTADVLKNEKMTESGGKAYPTHIENLKLSLIEV